MKTIWRLIKLAFFTGVALLFYAVLVEPYMLSVTPYVIENNALSGVKIVFATDFHIAPYPWEKWRLHRIVRKINEQNPDLVILGGDYVNRHEKASTMEPQKIAEALREITAPKVAVLGNHDSYYGKEDVAQALKNVGITVLDNQNVRVRVKDRWVTIVGVSDLSTDKPDVAKAFKNAERPVIFVTHSPDVFPQLKGRAVLTLAGHTHGGQVVMPFVGAPLVPSDYGQRYRYGMISEQNALMLVSAGLGTSMYPLRFNSKPEIVEVSFKGFFGHRR